MDINSIFFDGGYMTTFMALLALPKEIYRNEKFGKASQGARGRVFKGKNWL